MTADPSSGGQTGDKDENRRQETGSSLLERVSPSSLFGIINRYILHVEQIVQLLFCI